MARFNILAHNTTMKQLTTAIDGIHGTVTITINDGSDRLYQINLKWCRFDDMGYGGTGFISDHMDIPIMVSEVAAEQFIRMLLFRLIQTLDMNQTNVSIINHLGESIQDVEFMPPTFEGNEADIIEFVAMQDSIKRLFAIYEQSRILNSEFLNLCKEEYVLDDILCLIQIKAMGMIFAFNQPTSKDNQNG